MSVKIEKTDDQWRTQLTPAQYAVTRQGATEPPFSGDYDTCATAGSYNCVCCGAALFASDTKFDSRSGWPSFFRPIRSSAVSTEKDITLGMIRTEVTCERCDAHLGHVFPDGPKPTGQRYCINSLALALVPEE